MENATNIGNQSSPNALHAFPTYLTVSMKLNSFMIILFNAHVLLCLIVKRRVFAGNYWALVVCLSLSDILSGLGVWAMTTEEYTFVRTSRPMCSLAHAAIIISQIATLFNIFWICAMRYKGMRTRVRPNRSWNSSGVFVQMTVVWILSTAYCSVPFVIWKDTSYPVKTCSFASIFGERYVKAVGYLFGGLLLPLILTNIIYVALTLKIRKMFTQIMPLMKSSSNSTRSTMAASISKATTSGSGPWQVNKMWGKFESTSASKVRKMTHQIETHIKETPLNTLGRTDDCTKLTHSENCSQIAEIANNKEEVKRNKQDVSDADNSSYASLQRSTQHSSMEEVRLRRQRKSMRLIGTILILLNVFTWPSAIISALSLVSSLYLTYECRVVLLSIITLNSLINPFVYTLTVAEFRKAIKDMYISCYRFVVTSCCH